MDLFHEGRSHLEDFNDGVEDEVTRQPTDMNMNDKTYRAIVIILRYLQHLGQTAAIMLY